MASEEKISGGCMCGAVRYEVIGKPIIVAYCHCSDCRQQTGAPVVTWVAFKSQQVHFLNRERKIYESSPGIGWGFCDQCGSSLTWEGESMVFGKEKMSITELHISSLDTPEEFIPELHWFDGERIPWFDAVDNLPRYHKLSHNGAKPTHMGPKA